MFFRLKWRHEERHEEKSESFKTVNSFLNLLFSWGLLQAQVMRLGVHASLGYAWPHQDVLDKSLNSSLGIDLNLS